MGPLRLCCLLLTACVVSLRARTRTRTRARRCLPGRKRPGRARQRSQRRTQPSSLTGWQPCGLGRLSGGSELYVDGIGRKGPTWLEVRAVDGGGGGSDGRARDRATDRSPTQTHGGSPSKIEIDDHYFQISRGCIHLSHTLNSARLIASRPWWTVMSCAEGEGVSSVPLSHELPPNAISPTRTHTPTHTSLLPPAHHPYNGQSNNISADLVRAGVGGGVYARES